MRCKGASRGAGLALLVLADGAVCLVLVIGVSLIVPTSCINLVLSPASSMNVTSALTTILRNLGTKTRYPFVPSLSS